MRVHLQRDVEKLKRQILAMSAEVEGDVRMAVRAIEEQDEDLARQVIDREARTDVLEVDVEDECLKILALHQPVAGDLRYIVAVLKINQDLERIGDLAVHIAERGLFLCAQPPIDSPYRLGEMADKAQAMLKKVLDAFVNLNRSAAREVCVADGEIDAINREIYEQVKKEVMRNPALFEPLLQVLHIARHLERIADHATNIAEDLIYLIEGRIVRHTQEVSDKAAVGWNGMTKNLNKKKILFLCTGNSCRSQMAEGWTRQLKGDEIEPYSAGLEAHGLDPMAVKIMAEAGVDIRGQQSKTVEAVKDVPFDCVVTVCGHANENCPAWLSGKAKVFHAGFDDPPTLAKDAKTAEEARAHYRRVRDEIKAFVEGLPYGVLGSPS